MRLIRWTLLLLLLALVFGLCSCREEALPAAASVSEETPAPEAEPDPEYPVVAGGASLSARPGRVISLSPAITEKLCDLGYEGRVAGVSDYCDYPLSITSLPRFGTAQLPDIDEIVGAGPQLVFSSTQLSVDNTKALSDAGIPVAVLPQI
ncbi:MAG: ABC transporter substrate-binding protein, partial [Oscillospiraceae bacterium]|nr:ABC transporter substrate-binding protein [Oscillospiraceae bacterium]